MGDTFTHKGRTISDDRLRLVPLLGRGDLDRTESTELKRLLHRATFRPIRCSLLFAIGGAIGYASMSWLNLRSFPVGQYLSFACAGIGFGLVSALTFGAARSKSERRAVSRLKRLVRCASCGYSLRGLPPEPDGCVVCPECRAAWRLGGDPRSP